jgi:hypothetical protein
MLKFKIAAALALLSMPALAMDNTAAPPKISVPFANSASGSFVRVIPIPSQIGIQNGAASFTDGFPPLNFQPIASGGVPPFGSDFNGIHKQETQGIRWQQAGGANFWDSSYSTGIGGYPKGAIVMSNIVLGDFWMSIADNNTTNPDASGANWVPAPGYSASGDVKPSLSSSVQYGYVAANGTTIGNASSNATGRASADTQLLYRYVWTNCGNAQCPVLTSGGSPTTRGASADADFAANVAVTVYSMQGTGFIGVDTMGGGATTRLTGVPVTSGNSTTPGSVLGENLHSLTSNENGPHTHTITDPGHTHTSNAQKDIGGSSGGGGVQPSTPPTAAVIDPAFTGITINSSGLGTGHNTVERSVAGYWLLKL